MARREHRLETGQEEGKGRPQGRHGREESYRHRRPSLHSAWLPNEGFPCTVTGLDIWASLLSTGAICTFYTTVVSDPTHPLHVAAPCLLAGGDPRPAFHFFISPSF